MLCTLGWLIVLSHNHIFDVARYIVSVMGPGLLMKIAINSRSDKFDGPELITCGTFLETELNLLNGGTKRKVVDEQVVLIA